MPEPHDIVQDYRGQPVLHCSRCGQALTHTAFYELGLRLPDAGESRDDYRDAEVLDSATHAECVTATRAG